MPEPRDMLVMLVVTVEAMVAAAAISWARDL